MLSLRFIASIAVSILVSALMPTGALANGDADSKNSSSNADQTEPGQKSDKKADEESGKGDIKSDTKADKNSDKKSDEKAVKKSGRKSDKKADKSDKKGEKDEAGTGATAEPAALSATEAAALAAAAERARLLKTMSTPFNTANLENSAGDGANSSLSLRPGGSPLRNSLLSRIAANRVFLPGTMVIGKPAEFVVKGRPGSHVAIAMADKDSGAKPIGPITLRLGPDRKLVAAGTIPESGLLTLIVDMPIQGDLIGQPVFFETVVWQKPDFSDVELASPVKSESAAEIADKANAIIVAGEKNQKRGLRFVPDSGVPQDQQNAGLDSGRP